MKHPWILAACWVLLVAAVGAPAALATPVQWSQTVGGNGHYYEFIDRKMTWSEARSDAALRSYNGRGGHLVSITSENENTFIQSLIPDRLFDPKAWIGLTDNEQFGGQESKKLSGGSSTAGWVWVTGEPVTYTAWATNEPNDFFGEDYVMLNWGLRDRWNDQGASNRYGYVVEFPATTSMSSALFTYNATTGLLALDTRGNAVTGWEIGGPQALSIDRFANGVIDGPTGTTWSQSYQNGRETWNLNSGASSVAGQFQIARYASGLSTSAFVPIVVNTPTGSIQANVVVVPEPAGTWLPVLASLMGFWAARRPDRAWTGCVTFDEVNGDLRW